MNENYLHTIDIKKRFERSLKNLSKEDIKRVENIVSDLAKGEIVGKRLRGNLHDLKSLRVGSYRIIYEEPKKCSIVVLEVGHRRSIYNLLSF